jgi:hypothetical protein
MTALATSDLEEIKKWIQRGDGKTIAEKTGFHKNYVYNVLNGHHMNAEIICAAADIALERKARVLSKVEKIKQLQ